MSLMYIDIIKRNCEELEALEKTILLIYEYEVKNSKDIVITDNMKKLISIKISELSNVILKLFDDDILKQEEIKIINGEKSCNILNLSENCDAFINYYDVLNDNLNKIKKESNNELNESINYEEKNIAISSNNTFSYSPEYLFKFYYKLSIKNINYTNLEKEGKSIDLFNIYVDYYKDNNQLLGNNMYETEINKIDNIKKPSKKTYIDFLKTFHDFCSIPINHKLNINTNTADRDNKNINTSKSYKEFLVSLEKYLFKFYLKNKPLSNPKRVVSTLYQELENFKKLIEDEEYSDIEIINLNSIARYWGYNINLIKEELINLDNTITMNNINIKNIYYCNICDKIYDNKDLFNVHLKSKQHNKLSKKGTRVTELKEEDIIEKLKLNKLNTCKRQLLQMEELLSLEFYILIYVDYFKDNLDYAINIERLKECNANNTNNIDVDIDDIENLQNENETSQVNQELMNEYNSKKLPIGYDGKPIPYWLYKIQGLNQEYTCEICGNATYTGKKAFNMHFQEWKHAYGLNCLGIPNTTHFKDITKIDEALKLHKKLIENAKQRNFKSDNQQEYEDKEGNVYLKKWYIDLKSQGLIDTD